MNLMKMHLYYLKIHFIFTRREESNLWVIEKLLKNYSIETEANSIVTSSEFNIKTIENTICYIMVLWDLKLWR